MTDHIPALTDEQIIGLARRKLDVMCSDRNARITRATDAEIIAFARALLAAAPAAQLSARCGTSGQRRAEMTDHTPALTDEEIDKHLDAVLRAAGSALRHYTLPASLAGMRKAMRAALAAAPAPAPAPADPAQGGDKP